MAQILQYITFFKPENNKGEFRLYFELFEKSCRGRHHSEISKTNTKTMMPSLWMRPQGCQLCQKTRRTKWSITWCVFALIFSPNWTNFEKPHKIKKIYQKWLFCDGFSKFVQFGLNISAKTHQGIDPCALPVLLTPLAPLGARPYRFE